MAASCVGAPEQTLQAPRRSLPSNARKPAATSSTNRKSRQGRPLATSAASPFASFRQTYGMMRLAFSCGPKAKKMRPVAALNPELICCRHQRLVMGELDAAIKRRRSLRRHALAHVAVTPVIFSASADSNEPFPAKLVKTLEKPRARSEPIEIARRGPVRAMGGDPRRVQHMRGARLFKQMLKLPPAPTDPPTAMSPARPQDRAAARPRKTTPTLRLPPR